MWKSPGRSSLGLAVLALLGTPGCSFFEPELGPSECKAEEICGPDATPASSRQACADALSEPQGADNDLLASCRRRQEECDAGTAPKHWCTDAGYDDAGPMTGEGGQGGIAGSDRCRVACGGQSGSVAGGMNGGKGGMSAGEGGAGPIAGMSGSCERCPSGQVCDGSNQQQCVQCLSDDDCSGGTPACDVATKTCVGCTESAKHCSGQLGECNPSNQTCVQCLGKADCGAATPVCDLKHECVGCLADKDCSGATPACDVAEQECVGCTNSALHCKGSKPLCDSAAQACVQCLSHDDCTDPTASRCNAGQCQPCIESAQCDHIDDRGVCDESSGIGQCVQCTGKQYEACGVDTANTGRAFVCDSTSRTCSDQTAGSSGLCGQCVSDAECPSGQLCVLQQFNSTTIGYFCVWQRAAGVGGAPSSCTNARPYFKAVGDAESIDGTTADICTLAVSTCPAQNDFRSPAINCAPAGVPNDALCGFGGVADGYCRALPAPEDDMYRCTVPCGSPDDCRIGFECDIVSNPPYCKL
ncbi:MAG TPA: hypothetical protein VK524_10840 [Polyangiaceae bacterium]|nr:hypothetical protein [Polyangiaceae bacterium]